jgi:hypothetical protein
MIARPIPLILLVSMLGAGAADAASIAAHRAIYDLKLLKAGANASLSAVDGRLAFEVQGSACEGWTVNFRMVNRFSPSDGDLKTVDTQSTEFESGDGLEMQYEEKEFVDRKLSTTTRIKVSRSTHDAEASGELKGDDTKTFTVPSGAFFPEQHQMKLTVKAEAGETRDTSLVYDGSDGANAYRAITFIGRRKEAGANTRDLANDQAAPLKGLVSWPISISYYPTSGDAQDTPSYQVGFDLYDNGVATGLVLDYGDFTLGGELKNLEMLKAEPCP